MRGMARWVSIGEKAGIFRVRIAGGIVPGRLTVCQFQFNFRLLRGSKMHHAKVDTSVRVSLTFGKVLFKP